MRRLLYVCKNYALCAPRKHAYRMHANVNFCVQIVRKKKNNIVPLIHIFMRLGLFLIFGRGVKTLN